MHSNNQNIEFLEHYSECADTNTNGIWHIDDHIYANIYKTTCVFWALNVFVCKSSAKILDSQWRRTVTHILDFTLK